MKKLFKNIKKFYAQYMFTVDEFSKDDMYDHDALMSVYEDVWSVMEDYDHDETDHKFIADLYGDLGDYIDIFINGKPQSKIITIIKLAMSIFSTMSIGAFVAVWLECGYDIMIVVGIALATFLAVCSGIGTYEDIKVGE